MTKELNHVDLSRIVAKAKDEQRREAEAHPHPPIRLSKAEIAAKESQLMGAWADAVVRGDDASADNMMDEINRLKGIPVRKRR